MVTSLLMPLVIAGPTASGKSSLALTLAERFRGEIVCADSRQFYAGMSVGTACPSEEDMHRVPHHGYGSLDLLQQKFDAGAFVKFALDTISEVQKRGKRPILVGGTGLYLRSLYYGLGDVPKSDSTIARALQLRAHGEGFYKLYQELLLIDPLSAQTIKSNDSYRIIRALEIFAVTGKQPSSLRQSFQESEPQLKAHWVYKKPSRPELMHKIASRVVEMFNHGLVDEALALRRRLPPDHWALTVMGYHEALQYHDGILSRAHAEEKTAIRHRQYAKRQFTWFNKETFYRFIIS